LDVPIMSEYSEGYISDRGTHELAFVHWLGESDVSRWASGEGQGRG